uniref:Lysosomal Pro-X carboxypeptidase n=1 Tax=Globisporangium ultimum (strain ATCC 200006 / CBS 805.95 / DAOM BR144) TaxID=431595 RepID=K3WYQ5_GLOUD
MAAGDRASTLPLLGAAKAGVHVPSKRIKQLPMLFALVGVIVAPILLFVDFQSVRLSPQAAPIEQAALTSVTTSSYAVNADGTRDLLKECEEKYFTQTLDHFGAGAPTYEQRYFICNKHGRKDGVIFFYVGNEADVELYLNNTGLMWENAEEFGATLVFAEHRYFGKSVPFGKKVTKHMQYLSTEQALADYAVLITHIKDTYKLDVPVVGFGGSYGGMLGSWFRMKYPHIIDGVIAGSAPILAFLGDEKPVDMESFARVTTFDASPEAGSAANCIPNIRRVWSTMTKLGKTKEGRKDLFSAFSLCESEKLEKEKDVAALIDWAKSAIDYMAMGNYPYPSPYIMNGQSVLPAYPVRVACEHMKDEYAPEDDLGLLRAFRDSIGVYYNSTLDQECFKTSAPSEESANDDNFWQYLFCSELYMPVSIDGVNDMFWSVPWNQTADNESCIEQWGVSLRPTWAMTQYGGRKALYAASNIVLSNGNYDPWSGTGVLENISDSVVAVAIDGGAHHLDLFFKNELDPPSVVAAREIELAHARKWIRQYYEHRASVAA